MKHSDHIKVRVGHHTFALKNLEVYERMSEETTAFCADLYIGDFFVGTCENSGKGEGNYPRIYPTKKGIEDADVLFTMWNKICEEVGKHHFHQPCPYDHKDFYDWDYTMDFLIADMVYTAWDLGKATYKFTDEN